WSGSDRAARTRRLLLLDRTDVAFIGDPPARGGALGVGLCGREVVGEAACLRAVQARGKRRAKLGSHRVCELPAHARLERAFTREVVHLEPPGMGRVVV